MNPGYCVANTLLSLIFRNFSLLLEYVGLDGADGTPAADMYSTCPFS